MNDLRPKYHNPCNQVAKYRMMPSGYVPKNYGGLASAFWIVVKCTFAPVLQLGATSRNLFSWSPVMSHELRVF